MYGVCGPGAAPSYLNLAKNTHPSIGILSSGKSSLNQPSKRTTFTVFISFSTIFEFLSNYEHLSRICLSVISRTIRAIFCVTCKQITDTTPEVQAYTTTTQRDECANSTGHSAWAGLKLLRARSGSHQQSRTIMNIMCSRFKPFGWKYSVLALMLMTLLL